MGFKTVMKYCIDDPHGSHGGTLGTGMQKWKHLQSDAIATSHGLAGSELDNVQLSRIFLPRSDANIDVIFMYFYFIVFVKSAMRLTTRFYVLCQHFTSTKNVFE